MLYSAAEVVAAKVAAARVLPKGSWVFSTNNKLVCTGT